MLTAKDGGANYHHGNPIGGASFGSARALQAHSCHRRSASLEYFLPILFVRKGVRAGNALKSHRTPTGRNIRTWPTPAVVAATILPRSAFRWHAQFVQSATTRRSRSDGPVGRKSEAPSPVQVVGGRRFAFPPYNYDTRDCRLRGRVRP